MSVREDLVERLGNKAREYARAAERLGAHADPVDKGLHLIFNEAARSLERKKEFAQAAPVAVLWVAQKLGLENEARADKVVALTAEGIALKNARDSLPVPQKGGLWKIADMPSRAEQKATIDHALAEINNEIDRIGLEVAGGLSAAQSFTLVTDEGDEDTSNAYTVRDRARIYAGIKEPEVFIMPHVMPRM